MRIRFITPAVVAVMALLSTVPAAAAPGWAATGVTVMPADAPKVVAAFDALFASEVGQTLPGRVILRANMADGDNPETHTVVSLFRSAAEREKTTRELYADPAWTEFLNAVTAVNQSPGSTMRGVILYNSGERSDSDVIWVNHYLTVEEPVVVLNALRTFSETPTGKSAPNQTHLSAVVAAGPGGPSHIVSLGFASEAEWESWNERLQGDQAFVTMLRTLGAASDYHGATLQRDIKAWGKGSVAAVTALGK